MKSNKQRRLEIKAKRLTRAFKRNRTTKKDARPGAQFTAPVNQALLAPYNSYGAPVFVDSGYYRDEPFDCAGCDTTEVWTATQQKWWYEVAKGYVYSSAKYCRTCRRKEGARQDEARRVHQEGLGRKRTRRVTT
ncbi:MAG: hypothetical protein FJ145_19350 [Deltaproteobacteria bacterium]|nr:hypothetical protein [Deltaproteobacteria bacterium]